MNPVFKRIRRRAREISARFPEPDFYLTHDGENRRSLEFFDSDPVIARLKQFVRENIDDDFGHGMDHAIKVAIDAGALLIIEENLNGSSDNQINKKLRAVQTAGLLHDIRRKQENHASEGARAARGILGDFSFDLDEIEEICQAVQNHEAFRQATITSGSKWKLVSDCLYDADKFRWGPDNFNTTIWDMVSFSNIPPSEFVRRYPKGMESLKRIKMTFRTRTGKIFGPQFIKFGIEIGEQLIHVIQTEFTDALGSPGDPPSKPKVCR